MLKQISRGSFKLFLSGHGMSVKTGKYVTLAALVGVLVGFVTVAFYWMIHLAKVYVMEDLGHHDFMSMLPKGEIVHPFWTMESLTDPHRWLLVFLPAIGAVLATRPSSFTSSSGDEPMSVLEPMRMKKL